MTNFHSSFESFSAVLQFFFRKLSLVGTLEATRCSRWKAIQNAHFLPASLRAKQDGGMWTKERPKNQPLGRASHLIAWAASKHAGENGTFGYIWHCKETQLQIKQWEMSFRVQGAGLLLDSFCRTTILNQLVWRSAFRTWSLLLLDDTSVFCLAWLDVEVTHERYWSTLGKFGQPPETKDVSQRTSRKTKAPCQQQAAMNIDCSNFLCSSLAPKIGKSTCPPCMSRLRYFQSYQRVGWTWTQRPNKQGIWYVPTLNVFAVLRIFSLANTASLKPELRQQIGDTKWILLWSPMYASCKKVECTQYINVISYYIFIHAWTSYITFSHNQKNIKK